MDENLNNEELLDSENFEEQEDFETEIDENGLTEVFGDENYESFIMPDGTMNLRYIEKMSLFEDFIPIKLKFKEFPAALRNNIIIKFIFGLLAIIVSLIFVLFNMVKFKVIIPFIVIGILLLISALIRFKICQNDNIVKFEGITIHVEDMGLLKINKYQVVKISNNEKFLNVKLSYDKRMRAGLPITIYINKYEPIKDSEFGPLVENILTYSLNVNTKEDQEKLEQETLSAEEYINK
jgi:hypothetical protein